MKPQPANKSSTSKEEPVELRSMVATVIDDRGTEPNSTLALPRGEERYQMQRCLGQGAMGEVFAAKDAFLRRRVAFKRMNLQVAKSADLAARFLNEAQITAQLEHPNIIPIYGLETTADGSVGYAMKFIEGRNLTQLIDEERAACTAGTPEEEAHRMADRLRIFTRICDAMAYAHEKGVLHRDLKPDNVMIGRFNQVYVVDWGICRLLRHGETAASEGGGPQGAVGSGTQVGSVMGTPSYMSPEQARGDLDRMDERSDLYSLGLILFEIISLRPAIEGTSVNELLSNAAIGHRVPLEHADPRIEISAELRAIIGKATAPRIEDRYLNVAELTADLRRYRNGEAVQALPDTSLRKALRVISRHRGATLAVLLGFFLIGSGGILGLKLSAARQATRDRHHRQELQKLLLTVAQHGQRIESRIHQYEALLHQLSGRAEESLGRARPLTAQPASGKKALPKVFFSEDFDTKGRGPADLAENPRYGRPVSLSAPVFKLPAGVSADSVAADLQSAAQLTSGLRSVYEKSESSLYRVFLTLESGVHMAFPGRGGFPSEYDGRQRPKYRLAAGQHALRWGNAYLDLFNEPLLPCSFPLYDESGRFLGVAGLDLLLSEVEETLLPLPEQAHVRRVLLVDQDARVLVEWPRRDRTPAPRAGGVGELHQNEVLALPVLPYSEVATRLRTEKNGGFEEQAGQVIAFTPLGTSGAREAARWSLVVVVDAAALR